MGTGTISWTVGLAQLTHVRGFTRRVDLAGRSRASGGLTQQMVMKRSGGVLAYVNWGTTWSSSRHDAVAMGVFPQNSRGFNPRGGGLRRTG